MDIRIDKHKPSPGQSEMMLFVVIVTHFFGFGWGLLSIPLIAIITSIKIRSY